MIKRVSELNVKLEKSEVRKRQKEAEYVRTLQKRGCIKRYYINRKGEVVKNRDNKDGTTNFLAFDEQEYLNYKKNATIGRPKKEI